MTLKNKPEINVGTVPHGNDGEGDVGQQHPLAALDVLTATERRYVLLLALNLDRDEIAKRMGIRRSSVAVHHHRASQKFRIKAGAFQAWAVALGWTQ